MSKKRRKRRLKRLLILLIFLGLCCVGLYFLLFNKCNNNTDVVDEIKGYDYSLEDNATPLIKELFADLKTELINNEIDYKKYAEDISKLFIADLYTLNNKDNKYDIGGALYIYPEHRDNFKLKVKDTLYKYLEEKSNRKQKLPVVSSVEVLDLNEDTYLYNEKEYNAFTLDLRWEYEKDLGYDDKGSIIVIKDGNKLYIANYIPEVQE